MVVHATDTHDLDLKGVSSPNNSGTKTQLGFALQLFMEEDQAQKACGTRVLVLFHLFLRIKSCPVNLVVIFGKLLPGRRGEAGHHQR